MDTREQNCAGSAHQDVTGSTQHNQASTAHQNRASAAKHAGTTAAQHAHPSKSPSSPAVLSEQQKRSAHGKRIILLCVAVLCGVAYACVPGVQQWIHSSFGAMTTLNMADLIAYIQSFGPGAVAVSFLLMILQAIVAPIPAFFITLANAAIWGGWQGALLSWTSSMVCASL